MKKHLVMTVMALLGAALVLGEGITELVIGGGDPAVPQPLATNEIRGKTLVFIGNKSARVPNAGTVWIQASRTNDAPGIKLLSGQTISLTGGANGLDARQFWVDVETTNDGVVVLILQ